VTHGVNGLMILLTAGGETCGRDKSALSYVSDSVSSRQRGGTGAKSGGNRQTLRHPQNGECVCERRREGNEEDGKGVGERPRRE